MINIEDVISSKSTNDVFLCRNFTDEILSWKELNKTFHNAYEDNKILFTSFATFNINYSEKYTSAYNNIFNKLRPLHPGELHAAMTICHLITGNDNTITDPDCAELKDTFIKLNKEQVPDPLPEMSPTIHSDAVDGFFIQFNGQSKWRIYKNEIPEEYILSSGDLIFIPKGLNHSVESLCPRNSVSISFFDPR